ncbi:transmembrane protein 243-like [Amphiura filiformis]|uniref:transmembrane protein 243-like n=1 Tax=Amphiura filiformis TaxID=82378 RepID=UPI003B212384
MTMTSYYEGEDVQTPLFGEQQTRDRVVNLVVGVITSITVIVTLVSAFVFGGETLEGLNIYFACVIVLICIGNILLIYWYRQGDLDPKFRVLIYYQAFVLILLCVCANLYIHGYDK